MLTGVKRALAGLILVAGCAEPSAIEKMSRLERDVRFAVARSCPGAQLSLWLAQADGHELLALDADRPLPGASTLKVLILVEGFAQEGEGTFRWTDSATMTESDLVGGSGSFQNEKVGSSWTYLQYARRMIAESDNVASNILLRRLGMKNVNERGRKLGLEVTRFERFFMDFRSRDREGKENWTTAREMGRLLQSIYQRRILTPEACDDMIAILERTSRGRIAAGVPPRIPVGHKSGSLAGLRHDVGWVRLPGQPYVLSVFLDRVRELPAGRDEDLGLAAIEAVARVVYEAMGPTDE
jgi:beta-lactamase class A